MRPATWPRAQPLDERLLRIERDGGAFADHRVADLPSLLRSGDLLVANDAATLPASLRATAPSGAPLEVRLAGQLRDGGWRAVLFGAGDWRTATEHRAAPEALAAGDRIAFDAAVHATVASVSAISPRLIEIRFNQVGAALWSALYRLGRPIQYSYLDGPLELWHVQSHLAGRPWAVEQPSAGRPLSWRLVGELARRGVALVTLTHAAGLSSTGDPAIDAALPLPERYEIPARTVLAVLATRARGGRVVAVGTSVVRALEGCHAARGRLVAGEGETDLVLSASRRLAVVDGLFTGMHEPAATHFALLGAFLAPEPLLRAYAHADAAGYLGHEFGDSCLILPA